MTRGALIFAFRNQVTDYVRMAQWSAQNIRRHLDIPVAVITDDAMATGFDRVIVCEAPGTNTRYFSDYETSATWHNETRSRAYDLSPWDQTLLLDADYVVASDQLSHLFHTGQDFSAHRWATDITGQNNMQGLNWFGRYRMPQWWATVLQWQRSPQAKMIFDTMSMVRHNWRHYRELYHNSAPAFRNDHALSIALNTVMGYGQNLASIPWNLLSVMPEHELQCAKQDQYSIAYKDQQNRPRRITVNDVDFHAMNKQQLEAVIASAG